jgi:predicted ATPase with chaperone activity
LVLAGPARVLDTGRLSQSAGKAVNAQWNCGYNLIIHGPPVSGKTLLARCTPTILPSMTTAEMVAVSRFTQFIRL